ncbi:flagellar biosynthesis protein FlhA [Alkalithermobacter thermoalcaliphilus JW-YL-7 = DSM 7308]|uniref:Flagellar biosynthesis protein FlhA n=1 Tax=Alkalithermobacter thermoalcaliphilus JW-YL-7 = DSM 7308 TaxID=1121328 RepID=A0A150FRE7_CLOPD|nr:flagellar biosynthesis protein FlhA [[Clostridium] paradoxum JW-YL-7 = DSM 7308]SHK60632.1 flagellar biosynthesis protein FlhA [[Clostridium] paradoxum JW-YL-7 = DSM 7308]
MRSRDIVVTLGIIGIILMIIIPVPLFMLDLLLSLNISISLLILLISIYTKEALEFSVFPSLLLVTTLFRLALNITTTRYILSQGSAGDVIEAFGNFVMGGNALVGFIVFIIIVIIQFMVITKGAERVSEVGARFTLDAMPGKQMAIDADLNSGIIDEKEARERRKKIQMEADFYGAMDGASKFVKGDAIAGIIIALINIAAGLVVGMVFQGMPLQEAISRYTLLTVGDGLVSQIPALLISTGTGIVVTRAASESNLSSDVIKQLFNQPKTMFIVSGVLFFLGLTPLPFIPYFMLSIIFAVLGYNMISASKKDISEQEKEAQEKEVDIEEIRKPENVLPLLQVDPIELEFGYGIIPLADKAQGGDLFDRLVMIRRQCALEMGIIVPMIRLRDNIQLDANEYIIKIKGIEIARGEILFDHYLAMNPGNAEGEISGIDTIEPAFGLPAKWIDDKEREKAEILGYTVVDPPSIISTHLTEIIKRFSHELLGRQEVKMLVDNLKENYPALVEEVIPNLLSLGELQKVLCNLLKEGVPIRNLPTIIETLADYAALTKDTDMLTEYVRQALFRTITKVFIPTQEAKVITLDQGLEQTIVDSLQNTETGTYLALDPHISQTLANEILKQVEKLVSIGHQPIILTSPVVRIYLKRFIDQISEDIVVLSYNEIDPKVKIQSAGMVSV